MANVKFCYPNWTQPTATVTPTITGADWLNLSNLQGEVLSETARYPGVTPANTKLLIDLGELRNLSVLAIPVHNAGLGDLARIRVATDAGLTNIVWDTGWKEFFGEMYPYGALPWGRTEWLDGRYTAEQAAGLMPIWSVVAEVEVIGRYLDVQFDFSANASGVVDVGHIVAAPALSPKYNVSYGVKPPYYRDASSARRSKGGVRFADQARRYRVTQMQLDWLDGTEAYGQFFDMCRDYGTTKPFLFIYNSGAGAAELVKHTMMATAEKIGEPTHPHFDAYSMTVELSEAF